MEDGSQPDRDLVHGFMFMRQDQWRHISDDMRQTLWTIECPVCSAGIGSGCIGLTDLEKSEDSVHYARREAVHQAAMDKW